MTSGRVAQWHTGGCSLKNSLHGSTKSEKELYSGGTAAHRLCASSCLANLSAGICALFLPIRHTNRLSIRE
jgi:hypothetical protein